MNVVITRKEADVILAHHRCDAARWEGANEPVLSELSASQAKYWERRIAAEDAREEAFFKSYNAGQMD